ncbi:MAG: hypothetical protein VB954_10325 [Thalassolituus sp.]|uniref:hypothetical protein n=1 Tax=Thalassolituus sp. TaxID=2030822 RepID=UPI003981C49F
MNTINHLQEALENKDHEAVEFALYDGVVDNERYIDLLIALLPADWHYKHEDIARYLQKLKSPKSIDVLTLVAISKFEYLDYDNSESLARKCIWALADIGTEKAKESLVTLSNFYERTIAAMAQERLDNWLNEIDRKNV